MLSIPSYWLIDTEYGLRGCVGNGAGLRQPRATFPKVADQFEAFADDWLAGRGGPGAREFLRRLERADLVVLNGEGSIYRTNLSAIRELFLAWLAKERLGIPTVFVNGTLHLTGVLPVLPAMVRKTFPLLDAVTVREPRSLGNLADHAPGVPAQLFPDSAFAVTAAEARETPAVRSVRDRIGGEPYFCFDPGTMPMDDADRPDSALQLLLSTLRELAPRAVLVSSAPADGYVARTAHETGSVYVDELLDYREWMALVRDAQFLVSGRYHNVILAAIMGCPSIALGSTTHKVHGACDMLDGVVGAPYDGTHLIPELASIRDQAQAYVASREAVATRLQAICAQRHDEVLALGDLVDRAARVRS
jgi:polysaccharide pyruvyl transferase WcaK-like protein